MKNYLRPLENFFARPFSRRNALSAKISIRQPEGRGWQPDSQSRQRGIYFLAAALLLILLSHLLAINVLGAFLAISFILYFTFSPQAGIQNKKQGYLMLSFLFVIFIFISKKIIDYRLPIAYVPVTGLAMFVTILYNDLKLSFAFCVLAACFAGIMCGGALFMTLIFLITAMVSAILVWNLRRRMRILSAGLCAGAVQMLLFWLTYRYTGINYAFNNLFNGLICAIAVTGTLPLLEHLSGIVTNISLLELSDFNHPLLKKMILEAPGTYHHSLIVGNLAEAAAESIGANSLLARIGAYYHDIGKLEHPEYFMENQKIFSPHSGLSPSMSKMIIMHHIKEGLGLAKKYRLKPSIIDFISQHHGTSLVYYFYRRALEEIEQDDLIQEEGFRYPGPRPASKETAIVLLADSVEAASRVIADPQIPRIKEVVHKVINNKFIDGQLDNCELTLKDLEKIAEVFIHSLSGIYHGRIKYPEAQRREHQHKKPDQPNPAHQPGRDKETHPENS